MRLFPLIAAAAVAALLLAGLAGHWRRQAITERARADAAVRQARADTTVSAAADRAAREVRVILQNGQKEADRVQTLPGAQAPIDPVRRAGVCAALGRLFDDPAVCAAPDADRQPESAVPDAAP